MSNSVNRNVGAAFVLVSGLVTSASCSSRATVAHPGQSQPIHPSSAYRISFSGDTGEWVLNSSEATVAILARGGLLEIADWRAGDVNGDYVDDELLLYSVHYGSPIWHIAVIEHGAKQPRVTVIKIGISGKTFAFKDELFWGMLKPLPPSDQFK